MYSHHNEILGSLQELLRARPIAVALLLQYLETIVLRIRGVGIRKPARDLKYLGKREYYISFYRVISNLVIIYILVKVYNLN